MRRVHHISRVAASAAVRRVAMAPASVLKLSTSAAVHSAVTAADLTVKTAAVKGPSKAPVFAKIMAANRGEIAIRILRAATEMAMPR